MFRAICDGEFDKIYDIMTLSFPHDEIRSYQGQMKLLQNKNYKLLAIDLDGELCGFIALWEFEKFTLLEHFAVDKSFRNKGLGNKILKELLEYTKKKVILEVEYPTNDMNIRRIEFYKRNGYEVFDFGYVMPAYSKEHKPVPLLLMSNQELTQKDYEDFYDKIVSVVNKED